MLSELRLVVGTNCEDSIKSYIMEDYPSIVHSIDKSNGYNILMYTVTDPNIKPKIFKLLIEYGINLDYQCNNGDTVLIIGLKYILSDFNHYYNNYKKIKLLVKNGANLNIANNLGWTPLLSAILYREKYSKILKLLINYGVDLQLKTISGFTPLDIAINNDCINCVVMLLYYNAKVDLQSLLLCINNLTLPVDIIGLIVDKCLSSNINIDNLIEDISNNMDIDITKKCIIMNILTKHSLEAKNKFMNSYIDELVEENTTLSENIDELEIKVDKLTDSNLKLLNDVINLDSKNDEVYDDNGILEDTVIRLKTENKILLAKLNNMDKWITLLTIQKMQLNDRIETSDELIYSMYMQKQEQSVNNTVLCGKIQKYVDEIDCLKDVIGL